MSINFNKTFKRLRLASRFTMFIPILIVCCLTSCSAEQDELVPHDIDQRQLASHSLLIYIVADNNLSNYSTDSFEKIVKAYFNSTNKEVNLFVYMDNYEGTPSLYWLDPVYGSIELQKYPEINSVSPSVIREVCVKCFSSGNRNNPVNSVIFWSHGTNWLPGPPGSKNRSFGDDNGKQIDITDMADALKGLSINNLMFDACLMGSVEVAAQFANVADVLVASPAEILTTSFPYHTVIPELCTSNPDMRKVVDRYHDFYNAQHGQYRSGILTTVNLEGIKTLAKAFGELTNSVDVDPYLEGGSILSYDRESKHLFFDICQFATQCRNKYAEQYGITKAETLYNAFMEAFKDCDVYTRYTERFLNIPLKDACGLSVYVPGQIQSEKIDEYYHSLAWYNWTSTSYPDQHHIADK